MAEGELTMEDLFSLVGTLAKTTVVALFDVKAALSYVRIEILSRALMSELQRIC